MAARPQVPKAAVPVQVPGAGRRPGWRWFPWARVSRGPLPRPVPRPGGPFIPELTTPVPTTPWPGTGGGTSGVAAPARVPARPRHPLGSGWQSAKRLNGTEPPASPRPDQLQPQPPRATPRPGDPGPQPPSTHDPEEAESLGFLLGRKISIRGNLGQLSLAVPQPGLLIRAPLWSLCPSLHGWTTQLPGFSCPEQFDLVLPQIRVVFLWIFAFLDSQRKDI